MPKIRYFFIHTLLHHAGFRNFDASYSLLRVGPLLQHFSIPRKCLEFGPAGDTSIRFRSGENVVRISYRFQPSRDSTGTHGQIYYPFTLTPAGLWADRRIGAFSLKIKMEEGTLFTVPRNIGTPASPSPWRLVGEGNISRNDGTGSSDAELLYVYSKNGFLHVEKESYAPGKDLMIQIYKPLDHVEPLLRSIMGREELPGHETNSLNLFLEQFRRTVIGHDWQNVVEYLDPAYVQDRLYDELGGDRNRFLSEVFGGIDPQRITDLGYDNFPESVAVSSYVGYWRVEVEEDTEVPRSVARRQSGRPWSTPTDSTQRHAEVKDIRYVVEDGILRGEATFLAWSRKECPACIQQILLISDRKTGGLYDAVCVDMGIPGLFPGKEQRSAFEIRYPDSDTKIWAFPALQYSCRDAISLARQNFLVYKEGNEPIIGD